jgi:hypothetical protein
MSKQTNGEQSREAKRKMPASQFKREHSNNHKKNPARVGFFFCVSKLLGKSNEKKIPLGETIELPTSVWKPTYCSVSRKAMTPFKTTVPRRHTGRTESKLPQTAKPAGLCKNYHPYVNHAACVKHQLWWHNPALVAATLVSSVVAFIGLTSTFMLTPSQRLAFVPFSEPSGVHQQAENEFQSMCTHGQGEVTRGRIEAGVSEFKRAEAIENVNDKLKAELFNDIAITLHASGKSSVAAEYLEKAVTADPGLIAARSNLALVLLEQGDKKKAIKVLEEAIRLQPSNSCLAHRLSDLNDSSKLSL